MFAFSAIRQQGSGESTWIASSWKTDLLNFYGRTYGDSRNQTISEI